MLGSELNGRRWWRCPNICFSVLIHPFLSIYILKSGCSCCRVSLSFFCLWSLRERFRMSMSDHIKQRVSQKCLAKKVLLDNGKTGFFCFTRVGEPAHISKVFYLFGVEATWHTVLICCTMCGTEQPNEQPQIGDGGSNPVAINQVLIFFLCWVHMFSFSFFIC